jgi:hypothetical protein
MPRENWIWMPNAGHLIAGRSCQYHLATYVNGFIISTVGEYWPDREIRRIKCGDDLQILHLRGEEFDRAYMEKYGYEEVGNFRLYETMVFQAKACDCGCESWVMKNSNQLDFKGYDKSGDATKGHYQMCEKWDKKKNVYEIENALEWANAHEHVHSLKQEGIIDDVEYEYLREKLIRKFCSEENYA